MKLLTAVLILLASTATAQPKLEAAISPELKTNLDKFQADHAAKIAAVQDAYFATHGRYWQGIENPDTPPDELTAVKSPDLTKRPTDQAEKWDDVFKSALALPATWPASLRVDVYDGPRGKGWTLTLTCKEGGKLQVRTWNWGPETERHDKAWREVVTP